MRLELLGRVEQQPYGNHGGPTMTPGRLSRLLKFVAGRIDYGTERPKGRGVGIAAHFTFGGYAAHAIEVSVSDRCPSDGLSVWVPGFAALRAALTFGPS